MTLLSMINPAYSLSGFVVGVLVGLTGVGGGSLMTPILVLLFHFHPAAAVGTDLLYASITKTAGTAVHGMGGRVDWRIVGRLAFGSVPASILTILAMRVAGLTTEGGSALLSFLLGIALMLTALTLIFRHWIVGFAARHLREPAPAQTLWMTVAMGAILGVLVSISSVGAGAIGVTALILLYPKLPMARIVGSDLAHAIPLTLVGGIGHWFLGSIDWHLLGSLLVGSIPGVLIGSYVSGRVPDWFLRPILAAVLLLAGGRLVL
ncbi:MAG TPA: sulfite exporter TauE/SafE family protein [Aliidongia sp.]|nr:sulfite exporter TauE/SafE family protein [Aliidongia sp.]